MYVSLQLPPGLVSTGTDYDTKGRYVSGDLMRFYQGSIMPIGGWALRSDEMVSGLARASLTWVDNSNQAWIGIGTNTHLYVMSRSGDLSDITPVGFTPGAADATAAGGYGSGVYGSLTYGTPRPDSVNIQPASVWSLDTFGEDLVGVMDSDSKIYEWMLSTGTPAQTVANAPQAYALLTTQENILMALGVDGDPRYIKWSAIQDDTDWTPTVTNQARDATLQTQGAIQLGKRIPGGLLILTNEGAFLGTYVGPPFVYTFQRVGSGCGAVSRQCAAVTQSATYWMGRNGFYAYSGITTPLACDVQDYVFSDINLTQSSKITAVLNSDFNEVWWNYPSSSSIEIDRYVIFNYLEGTWGYGMLDRTSGTGSNGVLQYPVMISASGGVFDHEIGSVKDGRAPTLRSAPVELGKGDNVIMLHRYIPDQRAAGVCQVQFHVRQWPNGPITMYGPYDSTSPTDLRITGRQMEVEYIGGIDVDFRIGDFRFDAHTGGKR